MIFTNQILALVKIAGLLILSNFTCDEKNRVDFSLLIIINKISAVVKWAGCWRAQSKPPLVDQVTHLQFPNSIYCGTSLQAIFNRNYFLKFYVKPLNGVDIFYIIALGISPGPIIL